MDKAFRELFKFGIAFENSSKSGYTTEKILHALGAGTIPIYWGDPRVGEDFNEERFINCHAYGSFTEVVEEVRRLDNDDEAYLAMLQKPWFPGTRPPEVWEDPAFIAFLRNIIAQGPEKARRVPRYGLTSILNGGAGKTTPDYTLA